MVMAERQKIPGPQPNRPPEPPGTPRKPNEPKPFDGTVLMWMVIAFLGYYLIFSGFRPAGESIPYTQFKSAVVENRVASVQFEGDQIHGVFRSAATEQQQEPQRFTTVVPSTG